MEQIEVVEYAGDYKSHFKRLNYEWIEKYFTVEARDEYILTNPEEAILDKGGFIFFAKLCKEIVGTFALVKVDEDIYELAKMAVTEKYQHRGFGKMLMNFAIQKAKALQIKKLVLYSNTSLTAAISMYIKFGFRSIPKNDFHSYRSNIKMELIL